MTQDKEARKGIENVQTEKWELGLITDHVLCFEKAAFGGGRLDFQSFGVSQKKFKCSIKVWQVYALKNTKTKKTTQIKIIFLPVV